MTVPWQPCLDHADFERECPECWRERVSGLEEVLDVAEDIVLTWRDGSETAGLDRLFAELASAIDRLEHE